MKQTESQSPHVNPDPKQLEPAGVNNVSSLEDKSSADTSDAAHTSLADRLSKRVLPVRAKSKLRRIIGPAVVIGVLLGVGVWLYHSLRSRAVRVDITAKATDRSADATTSSNNTPDDPTSEALAEIKTILAKPASVQTSSSVTGSPVANQQNPSLGPPPLSVPPENVSSNKLGESADRQVSQPASRRNQEHSIRFDPDDDDSKGKPSIEVASGLARPVPPPRVDNQPGRHTSTGSDYTHGASSKASTAPVALPSFGAILPVRTLGKIYTLRSGSIIRLELTRYVSGEGWSLPKGTTLIGQIRGSDQDRAFIAVTGFIDRDRDRFVKLGGEALGDDGASGIRGKFHKLSSGWSRAFARVASTAVNVAGAVASSRISGQPVIITDAGSRAITPFGSEVHSSLLNQARGFVEVPAGTAAFVMVTTLPAGVEAIDATPDHLASNINTVGYFNSPQTFNHALTQDEVAELLTSGDPERIREALPRMSPQMRSLAEVMLAESAQRQSDKVRQ